MAIFRDEINKLVIRLSITRDKMTEDGYTETARLIGDAITRLNSADQTYIQELAVKKGIKNKY